MLRRAIPMTAIGTAAANGIPARCMSQIAA
jgi:hypothetical protein